MSDVCCETCAGPPAPRPEASARRPSRPTWMLVTAGIAIGAGVLAAWRGSSLLSLAFYLVAIGLAIVAPARRALTSIRARTLDINALMVIAVIGAAALGDWLEAAVVVWLFGVAQYLEAWSLDRARVAIRALMTLAPTVALVRRDGVERQIPAAAVEVGDVVIVRPGERIPVDGHIVSGASSIDESPVTGESWPADREAGDSVYAGTVNGLGALEVEAGRPASDSTLARILHLVERAQAARAPIQTFVDRFARRYTPAVVLLALGVAVVPPLLFAGAPAVWLYRAMALLVVACPCALVISTPVAVVSALTAAAREGVLIKGGVHLERLGSIRCVAFDKTGTLTHGRITVTDVLGVDGVSHDGVLSVAAALESRSEHPIGRAIVDKAREDGLAVGASEGFRVLPGRGAEARVAEAPAIVGSHRLFEERQLCTPALHDRIAEVTDRGATPVLVSHGGSALGVIGLSDQMRGAGRHAVTSLREQGIGRIVLLTGDSRVNADSAMATAGLDEAHAELLPEDKVRFVAALRERYGPVAMVGDGVNDAPALAAADVGIAMGVAGTDVALETADVALMADDLQKLPYALRLGRATRANIRVNVALALGLKFGFVILAASGLATLWMAILADTGASLIVTAHSLRLLRTRA